MVVLTLYPLQASAASKPILTTLNTRLFPGAHWYPHYAQRLVKFDISNNGQDFSDSGLTYLYQAPATVEDVSPKHYGVSVGNGHVVADRDVRD